MIKNNEINKTPILFPFCPADAAIVANIPQAVILKIIELFSVLVPSIYFLSTFVCSVVTDQGNHMLSV